MKYTFNNTSLVTGYIKELLRNFNLPTCKVYKPGNVIDSGRTYLEGNYFYSGELKRQLMGDVDLDGKITVFDALLILRKITGLADLTDEEILLADVDGDGFITVSDLEKVLRAAARGYSITPKYLETTSLRKRGSFEIGNQYENLTKNLVIRSNYYDSYTHEYLGDYLRFIRDYQDVDLMPLYNCYSNIWLTSLNKYYVKTAIRQKYNLTDNGDYIYYLVPVKFYEKYTISLSSDVSVEVFLMLGEDSNLNMDFITGIKSTDGTKTLVPSSLKRYSNIQKNKPVIYDTYDFSSALRTVLPEYWTHEENLKMVIKLPKWVKTSVTVLEGDYRINTSCLGDTFFPRFLGDISSTVSTPFTKLSLLENIATQSYPFADRLVEYLFNLTITKNNIIRNNVGRIQKKVYNRKEYGGGFKGYFDIFDGNLKDNIYNIANQNILQVKSGEYKVKKISEYQAPTEYYKYYDLSPEEEAEVDPNAVYWSSINKTDKYLYSSLVDREPDILYWVDKDIEGLVDSL